MKLQLDECIGPRVAEWLVERDYDVVTIFLEYRGLNDEAVLDMAVSLHRVLVTIDKGFGARIFRDRRPHAGLMLLRLGEDNAELTLEGILRGVAALEADPHADVAVVSIENVRTSRS